MSYPVMGLTPLEVEGEPSYEGLNFDLAPLSPGSLEHRVLFSDEKQVLYFSNFLDSTGGVPTGSSRAPGIPPQSSRDNLRNKMFFGRRKQIFF